MISKETPVGTRVVVLALAKGGRGDRWTVGQTRTVAPPSGDPPSVMTAAGSQPFPLEDVFDGHDADEKAAETLRSRNRSLPSSPAAPSPPAA